MHMCHDIGFNHPGEGRGFLQKGFGVCNQLASYTHYSYSILKLLVSQILSLEQQIS